MRTLLPAMLVALIVAALLPETGRAIPAQAPGHDRDQVVQYWTPDRVARAIPREVSPDRRPTFAPTAGKGAAKPGGSPGTAVTGAHWTKGGAVFNTTGKVLFTMASVDYVCSGSVVADSSATTSLVLTAGHCAYDESGHAFATNWMFVPAYEDGGSIITNPNGTHSFSCDTVRYGCWTAQALVTTSAWASGNGSLGAFNDDYAFAVVGAGGKTGESNQLDTRVGANQIGFNVAHPTTVYAFGYPQAPPYDGQALTYCSGNDVKDTWGGTTDYGLNCNMTGGSSGGPWFTNFDETNGTGTLNSVNSFKYTYGPLSKNMFGPYFDAYTEKTYNAAKAGPGGNLIIVP